MGATRYQLVYSMSEIGFGPWFVAILGALFLCAGVLILRGPAPASVKEPWIKTVTIKFVVLLIGVVWALGGLIQLFMGYQLSRAAANPAALQTVEGPVRNFNQTTTAKGVVTEKFCVQSTCFEYSDHGMPMGLNPSEPQSRLVRDGRVVRIGFVSGTIVRMEVAR